MTIPGATGTLAERLPNDLHGVPYAAERSPGAASVSDIREGGNCQLYAYAVLEAFELSVPPLRSSELWTDPRLQTVEGPEHDLDLVLYNDSDEPFGAHVGVVVGTNAILHLCAEVGRPVVWDEAAFAGRDRYRKRIGARRLIQSRELASGEAAVRQAGIEPPIPPVSG